MNNMKITEETDSHLDDTSDGDLSKVEVLKPRKKTRKKWPRWQKIFFWCIIIIILIILGALLAFFSFRLKGKMDLKVKEQYTTYNGKRYKYRQGLVNILCLGIDKGVSMPYIEAGRGNIGMSDAIILVSIDTKRHEVKAIAIPRDTVTEIQTTRDGELSSKERMQLCIQYAYGISMQQSNELTVDAVSKMLYNLQIQRCCAINFEALPIINDAIGGVDVEVREDIQEWESRLPFGEIVHLEGDLALRFVKVRNKHDINGAALRTERQKQYIEAFIGKAKKVVKKDLTIPFEIFQELQKDGNMCTDLTAEDITFLMPEVLRMSFSSDMVQMLPGESAVSEDGYTVYCMDMDAVKEIVINTFYEEVD
ncbi:LCP family protein [Lachnospiraceae bacterium 29-91]